MNLSEFSASKYLGKAEVPNPIQLTIASFGIEPFDTGPKPFVIWLEPDVKPMLLNRTNRNRLQAIFGTGDTGHMIGRRVVVFNDPMVEMQGQMVGGLRIRPVEHAPVVPFGPLPVRQGPPALGSLANVPEADLAAALALLQSRADAAAKPGPAGTDPFDQEVPF